MLRSIGIMLVIALASPSFAWRWGSRPSTSSGMATKIKNVANKYVDSTKWSYASKYGTGASTNKYSQFVADVVKEAGGSVPQRHWWSSNSPIGPSEWGNPSSSYLIADACWMNVNSPRVGDTIGNGVRVGIITGVKSTTIAAHDAVVRNNFGFRPKQKKMTYWRYNC